MRLSTSTLVGALALVACGRSDCVTPPCAPQVAVSVSVRSAVSGLPITNAFVQPSTGTSIACNQAPGNVCLIMGNAGTYDFAVGAPGYQTMLQTVVVTGTNPTCGCGTVNTESIQVGLVPVTKSAVVPARG
jgi:hypothetical protein